MNTQKKEDVEAAFAELEERHAMELDQWVLELGKMKAENERLKKSLFNAQKSASDAKLSAHEKSRRIDELKAENKRLKVKPCNEGERCGAFCLTKDFFEGKEKELDNKIRATRRALCLLRIENAKMKWVYIYSRRHEYPFKGELDHDLNFWENVKQYFRAKADEIMEESDA